MENFKIAFTGSSGAGKTTLVLWLVALLQERDPEYKHISGSAGDVKTEGDKMLIDDVFKYPGGGHSGVIRFSALNPEYGLLNQKLLQLRRNEIIFTNNKFVTDRSPVDNLTYMINQTAFHPMVTDELVNEFAKDSLKGFEQLTHLIYVKAVQPKEVEKNGSRVSNWWYQQAVDAQFERWLRYLDANSLGGPEILVLNYWDLEERKQDILSFLGISPRTTGFVRDEPDMVDAAAFAVQAPRVTGPVAKPGYILEEEVDDDDYDDDYDDDEDQYQRIADTTQEPPYQKPEIQPGYYDDEEKELPKNGRRKSL